jgi:hypothetical protein
MRWRQQVAVLIAHALRAVVAVLLGYLLAPAFGPLF